MSELVEKVKNNAWIFILAAALVIGVIGVFRGEAGEVLDKARIICLECIGIG
jgi:hypothetical protein